MQAIVKRMWRWIQQEIASTSFTDPEAAISVLKGYMQTGKFSRGRDEFTAQALFKGGIFGISNTYSYSIDRIVHNQARCSRTEGTVI